MNKPKILILDIETRPTLAYVWRLFKENIGIPQIVEAGSMSCVGAKWFNEKEMFFFSDWEHGHEGMVKGIHALMAEADAIVTYNGDKFDIPKLNGEFLVNGLEPLPPITSIDVYKVFRHKLGFLSNKLAYVGPALNLGAKIKHEGFDLWRKVNDGDEGAQRRMARYCMQDVRLLEKVYKKVRPFITNHPHLALIKGNECGACGSRKLQSRGTRRTKAMAIQRLHCQNCGSWMDGKREKVI